MCMKLLAVSAVLEVNELIQHFEHLRKGCIQLQQSGI